jgi:hypothetical protein
VASSATPSSASAPQQPSPGPAAGAGPGKPLALSFLAASKWLESGWSVSAVFTGVAVIVGVSSYFAGLQSASLQVAQLTSQLHRLQKDAGTSGSRPQSNAAPVTTAPQTGADSASDYVRKLEAQNTQYHILLDRQDAEHSAGRSLLSALGVAQSRLIPMKAAEGGRLVIAYLITAPGSRFVFVASSLPPVQSGHQYQLWFFKGKDAAALRGPVFDLKQPTAIDLNQVLPSGISSLEITQEPTGGSDAPTGAPIASCSLER